MSERRIDGEFVTTMLARAHGGSVPQADADGIANFIGPMDNLVEAGVVRIEFDHEPADYERVVATLAAGRRK